MIEKIGGITPNQAPRKSEPVAKAESPVRASDNLSISEEALKAAEAAKIQKLAHMPDESRAEKIKEVREKLARGDYDNLSEDMLNKVADRVAGAFQSNVQ